MKIKTSKGVYNVPSGWIRANKIHWKEMRFLLLKTLEESYTVRIEYHYPISQFDSITIKCADDEEANKVLKELYENN